MVINMIKKLFKVVIPIFLAVLCGSICGKLVFSSYDKKIIEDLSSKKIYLIQAGAYSNYDNMVNNTLLSNYVYLKDDGLYKSIVGLTLNKNNIEKITNTYNGEVIITEYYSKDKSLNKKINEYDKKIETTTNDTELKKIVLEMLELYKDNDSTIIKVVS